MIFLLFLFILIIYNVSVSSLSLIKPDKVITNQHFYDTKYFKDIDTLNDIKNEILWAGLREFTNLKSLKDEDYNIFINNNYQVKKENYNYILTKNKNIKFYYYIPTINLINLRKDFNQNFIRILPNSLHITADRKWTMENSQLKIGSRGSFLQDHPSQNISNCIDYMNFGAFGPYWPTYSLDSKEFSYEKEGGKRLPQHLNMEKTKLEYELLKYLPPTSLTQLTPLYLPPSSSYELVKSILNQPTSYKNQFLNKQRHAVSYHRKLLTNYSRGTYLVLLENVLVPYYGSIFTEDNVYFGRDGCLTKNYKQTFKHYKKMMGFIKQSNLTFSDIVKTNEASFVSSFYNANTLTSTNGHYRIYTLYNSIPSYYKYITAEINKIFLPNKLKDSSISIPHYNKVFLLSGYSSNNFHHLLINSLTRLAFYLDFLQKDTSVKIHLITNEYLEDNQILVKNEKLLHQMLLKYLNIDPSRIIYGTFTADLVFSARPGRCDYEMSSSYNLIYIVNKLLHGVFNNLSVNNGMFQKYPHEFQKHLPNIHNAEQLMSVNHPYIYAMRESKDYIREFLNYNKRMKESKERIPLKDEKVDKYLLFYLESDDKIMNNNIIQSYKKYFPNYKYLVLNNKNLNTTFIDSFTKDVVNFARADIMVSVSSPMTSSSNDIAPNSGFAHFVFAKPNSLVVEIKGDISEDLCPICGKNSNLASIFGHDYLVYTYNFHNNEILDSDYIAKETLIYYYGLQSYRFVESSKKEQGNIDNNEEKLNFVINYHQDYPFLWYNINNVNQFYTNFTYV